MKIAVATEDKVRVGAHFGACPYIAVFTVEHGEITKMEVREKPGHQRFAAEETHPQTNDEGKHGFGPDAESRHRLMYGLVTDCDVVIAGLMGIGAHEFFRDAGLEVITTDVREIDEVLSLYLKGKLKHLESRLD
jgi:predicted Fe-Mo cluster-binding NifX family protein